MQIRRLAPCALSVCASIAILSGCSNAGNVTPSPANAWSANQLGPQGGMMGPDSVARSMRGLAPFVCCRWRPTVAPRGLRQLRRLQAPLAGTFTTIDDPHGTNGTQAWGINARGDIVGPYFDSQNAHGFLWRKGRYTTLDNPKAGNGPPGPFGPQGTYSFDINESGDIAGAIVDSNNVAHAFVLRNGVYHDFDEPHAGSAAGQGTGANTVDDRGDVVGFYVDGNNVGHGFVKRDGAYSEFKVPSAPATNPWDVNPKGTISGDFSDINGVEHGFLLRSGKFTTLDAPKSQATATFRFTPQGGLVGFYIDSNSVPHGLVLCNGKYTTFDDPQGGHGPGQGSQLNDVALGGDGTGLYVDSNNVNHGYLFRPSHTGGVSPKCDEGGASGSFK
jgi:hypothetical protein